LFPDIVSTPEAKGDNVGSVSELGSLITVGVPDTVPLESMAHASALGFSSFSNRRGWRQCHQFRKGKTLTGD
jgi:hypothetical protein